MATARQTRRPHGDTSGVSGAGHGVDAFGGPAIDPTENVLALVDAQATLRDALRDADNRYQDAMRAAEALRQDQQREAEARKQDALREQRDGFEARIAALTTDFQKQMAANLSAQTDKSALLLSTTVDKLTQATTERLAAVEKNQYVSGGKSSVTDPATADALNKMALAISSLTTIGDKSAGSGMATDKIIAYGIAAAGILFGVLQYLK